MAGDIVIAVEHSEGEIEGISRRLLGKGRTLADKKSAGLVAMLIGHNTGHLADVLRSSGPDEIVFLEDPELEEAFPEQRARAMADIIKGIAPSLILMGYTYEGMEVGPALASHLGISLISNGVDVEWSGASWIVTRSVYEGFYHVRVETKAGVPFIVSLQPAAVRSKPVCSEPARIRRFGWEPMRAETRMKVVEVLKPALEGLDISKADVIVAAGRGIGNAANLKLIQDLADALGGVVAGSRPVIDLGWLEKGRLVGMSGKTVSPRVYIACGISGAAQHTAGMSGSGRIIAIDKNPNAPIFQVAHYGIVGDLFQIVPAVIREASQLKAG